jgi:hypothetical protein
MAEVTIRLQTNPVTGKKDIIVSLGRDEDLLPHEHEQMHRALVEKLLNGGLAKAVELGEIVVERASESAARETPQNQGTEDERPSQSEEN